MDSNPSQTLASTPMVAKMHKEDQQATGDLNSLGVTSEEGAHSQLSSGLDKGSKNYTPDHTFAGTNPSVLVDKTKSTEDGSQTAHNVSGTKVDTRSAFMDDEDQEYEPFIALKESSEEYAERNKDTHAEPKSTSVPPCRIQESLSLHHGNQET
ncbi:hypothetical protein Tco_0930955 [Tanacetum coccineum]